jgi:hypothetical protein
LVDRFRLSFVIRSETVPTHAAVGGDSFVIVNGAEVSPMALLISGTVGAGKTGAAEAVGSLLEARGVPGALIDLDAIRRSWPSPPDDPFNNAMELRNLAALARNYLDSGTRRLVLSGVLEVPAIRCRYQDAVQVPLVIARLRVDLATIRRRLRRRHDGDRAALRWHLHRCGELDGILEAAGIEDVVIDATSLTTGEVAAALVHAAGWDDCR